MTEQGATMTAHPIDSATRADRVEALLARMSVDQKVGQMIQAERMSRHA